MQLTNEVIGKYVMRTKPCFLGKEKNMLFGDSEEILDYSFIGEKVKILSLDNNIIRYSTKDFNNAVLDCRWLDDNWAYYDGDKYEDIPFEEIELEKESERNV